MSKLKVRIEKDDDGSYIAYNIEPDNLVLLGRGDTVQEAKDDFLNSIAEAKECEGVPSDYLEEEPEFSFDISSLFDYFSMINASGLARYIGINPSLMRAYRKGDTYVSDKQLKKIEDGLHDLGNKLSSLRIV